MTRLGRFAWVPLVALAACGKLHSHSRHVHNSGPVQAVDPKLVDMTADATSTLVLANHVDELAVRVRVAVRDLPATKRPRINLGLVLDTSGSMEGTAIDALRASAKALVRELRDGDVVSVVTFDSQATVLVPSTVISSRSRGQTLKALDRIVARGTTDLYGGLAAGVALVNQNMQPQGINRIVLLSDGVPNSAAQLPTLVAGIRSSGVSITSLGLGIDYDATLMTQLARDTGGTFRFLEKPSEIAAVFHDELGAMSTVVARNATLVLQPGPGVTIDPMPGLVVGADGKLYAALGDLPARATRELMIPLHVAARGPGSTAELVSATLTFDDLVNNSGNQRRDAYVGVKASADAPAVRASMKIALEAARVRASAAAAILEAVALVRGNQIVAARERIAVAIAEVRREAVRTRELDDVVVELESIARALAQLPVPPAAIGVGGPPPPVPPVPQDVEVMMRKAEEGAAKQVRGEPPR